MQTETVSFPVAVNGTQTAVIGETKTTGNTLTITIYDSGLSGGTEAVTYTVLSGDTLSSIASAIASAINADSNLSGIGISATAVGTVVNMTSTSLNSTSYKQSTSGGATETISLGNATGVTQAAYNNVNELTGLSAGGSVRMQGRATKALASATINSNAVNQPWSQTFNGNATVSSGNNDTVVEVIDGASNTNTKHFEIGVPSVSSSSLTSDANGNMINDGTNVYVWDAENRLVPICHTLWNAKRLYNAICWNLILKRLP